MEWCGMDEYHFILPLFDYSVPAAHFQVLPSRAEVILSTERVRWCKAHLCFPWWANFVANYGIKHPWLCGDFTTLPNYEEEKIKKTHRFLITKREVMLVHHWRRKLIIPCKTWRVLRDLSATRERWGKANSRTRLGLGHNSLSCHQIRRNIYCPLFLA